MTNPLSKICSVAEAAEILGVSEKRVLVFVAEGRIEARRLKREFAISRPSVMAFAEQPREGGRPPKAILDGTAASR